MIALESIEISPKSIKGVYPRDTNGRIIKFWERAHALTSERAKQRKASLLESVEKAVNKSLKEDAFLYPDIIKLAKNLNIPYSVLAVWLRDDKEFKAKLDLIEGIAIQDCRKVVYNGKNKNLYIAMQLLNARAPEFQKEIKHSGTFSHFHIVSNVRSGSGVKLSNEAERAVDGAYSEVFTPPGRDEGSVSPGRLQPGGETALEVIPQTEVNTGNHETDNDSQHANSERQ